MIKPILKIATISCCLLLAPSILAQAPVYDAETMQMEDTQDFPSTMEQAENR